MLTGESFSFTAHRAWAFSESAGPTRVALSARAVSPQPARFPSQMRGRFRA